MRSFLLIALIIFCSFPSFAAEPRNTADMEGTGVTVLIYHRFGEDKYPTTNISLDSFREQLEFLKQNNYRVIPLEHLIQALNGKSDLPDHAVVITIDDGYRSVYTKAWPLLKEYGYPFTVFIFAKAMEEKHPNYMSWDHVREMLAAGVDIQNHGFSHEHMAFRPPEMDMDEYRVWIRADLAASTKILSEELRERPRYFALPYGEYNRILVDEIRSFGYEGVLTQDPGSVSRATNPFAIPREPILGYEWSTLSHFQTVLERVDLPIENEVPVPGMLPDRTPGRFGATLLYPERYLPGTLGIYVSELGWQPAKLEGNSISITNSSFLKRKTNRVAVSGREKGSGRTAIRYWMLIGE